MILEEIPFLDDLLYGEYLKSCGIRGIEKIKASESSSIRLNNQFNMFMESLNLIQAKDLDELMKQRHNFILRFSKDSELDKKMSLL
jgi:hypothetical protein